MAESAALLVFLFAWWKRGFESRPRVLLVCASIALLVGIAGLEV
jgi:hypothetical protein